MSKLQKGSDMMKLLVFVLNNIDLLDDLLENFIKTGIKGATIIESTGMARVLTSNGHADIPIFGSLKLILSAMQPFNKTIFVALKNEEVDKCIKCIKEVVGNLDTPNSGILFTLPIDYIEGL